MRTTRNVPVTDCAESQSIIITDLIASSLYYIAIAANTAVGTGPYTDLTATPSSQRKLVCVVAIN